MTKSEDPEIKTSELSGRLTSEGMTVDVQIYRVAGWNERWKLKVIDERNVAKVWDQTFATDRDAYAEFYRTIESDGIVSLFGDEPLIGKKH